MLMDPMGGIVMTNDGNAILREVWKLKQFFNFPFNIRNQIFQTHKGLSILRKSSYSFKFTVPLLFLMDNIWNINKVVNNIHA